MTVFPRAELYLRCPARLGEGICWHPECDALAWIDILAGRVYESRCGAVRDFACNQMVGTIAPVAGGGYIAALRDGLYLLQSDGALRRLVGAPYDPVRFRFNDGKADRRGRLWVGTLSLTGVKRTSALYCWTPGGELKPMLDGISISNGMAWSTDGRRMYYIDSPTRSVREFAFDGEQGTISGGRTVVTFAEADGLPDGCTLDVDGNIWVAHWGGSQVTQTDPRTGRVVRRVAVPVRNVTSCAFGGPKLDRLFISTARDEEGPNEPLAGSVFVCNVGTMGLPANLIALPAA